MITGICPSCFYPVDAGSQECCEACGCLLKQPWPFSEEETWEFITEGLKSQARREGYPEETVNRIGLDV